MRSLIALALGILAFAGLTAQTPAPAQSPPQSSGKPLRHLEYKFTDDFEGVYGQEFNAIGNAFPGASESVAAMSSGVTNTSGSEGGRGTMYVDCSPSRPTARSS